MAVTLEQIKINCGYSNYDAMREAWKRVFADLRAFPEDKKAHLPQSVAIEYLRKIASPYPNKSELTIQGALAMLESLQRGDSTFITPPEKIEQKPRKQNDNPAPQKVTPPTKEILPQPNAEQELRLRLIEQREADDRKAREQSRADERQANERQAKIDAILSPWINGLTWALNALEMFFLAGGLYVIAGLMGLVVGVFLSVLGTIVLLLVRLTGSAGGTAVFAWFVVCSLGGWLVEYPAMLDAIETSGRIVDYSGNTDAGISVNWYAGIVTALMSGSSFAGTYFRYQKSRD